MRTQKKPHRFTLIIIFAIFVFCILTITMFIVGILTYILVQAEWINPNRFTVCLLTAAIVSIIVGTTLSVLIGKIPVLPMKKLIDGLNALASGNYQVRLNFKKFGKFGLGKDLEESFNLMAEELQNTEMLRSDFVNHFSHEFKTPLVSIQGFARILQRGNLSKEKEQEYLHIIVSESTRLTDMATKILDLTKLENQSILTNLSEYNLSEQLRESILLLERKWTEKNLEIVADFEEYQIFGNPEMLKQVWINLLDNAIKFSDFGGTLDISVQQQAEFLAVSISDTGVKIPEAEQKRIFQKFYQCDASHTAQGNGIGLAIVHRIVELHEGTIQVDSTEEKTTFTVLLPRE